MNVLTIYRSSVRSQLWSALQSLEPEHGGFAKVLLLIVELRRYCKTFKYFDMNVILWKNQSGNTYHFAVINSHLYFIFRCVVSECIVHQFFAWLSIYMPWCPEKKPCKWRKVLVLVFSLNKVLSDLFCNISRLLLEQFSDCKKSKQYKKYMYNGPE